MVAGIAFTSLMERGRGVKLCIQFQLRNRNCGSLLLGHCHLCAGVKPSGLPYRSFLTVMALLCLLGSVRSFALDPAKSVYQYNCQSWTRREDLPANGINAITQTKDGYLWLGTSKGLVRFDGFEFKVIGLPDNVQFQSQVISSLSSSKAGGLWFGLNTGSLGYYDGQNFSPATNVSWVERSMDVRSIWEDSNAVVWVASQTVTGQFVKGAANEMSFGNQFKDGMSIGSGSRGRVWVGTAQHGLYYWHDGKIARFPDDAINQSIIFAVAEDAAGQIWVGTENGLRCYDANFQRKEIGVSRFEVRALLVDRHGVVWIGTSGNGLMCYKNGRFTSFKKSGGLVNDFVTTLFEDREGSLWIGTRDGLNQITDLKLPIYSSTEGLIGGSSHAVSASPKGGLWVAMSGGMSYFDGKQARNYTPADGLPNPYIKRVLEAKNGDIYLIDGLTVGIYAEGKMVARYTTPGMPVAMAEDPQGVVVSVVSNLFRASRTQFVPYAFKDGQAPPFVWIHNLAAGKDGSLWLATVNGIFWVKDGTCQQWSVPEGLSWYNVHSIFEDNDGTIWAGLLTGMARLKNNQIRNIAQHNGLFDNFIFAIVPDDFGYFWVDSMRGIFRVSRQSLNDFCDGKTDQVKCEAYDGLEAVKTVGKTDQEWVGCKTKDGRIWFPSSQGVVMIDPTNLCVNPTPPLVYIRQVRVNGKELKDNKVSAFPHGKGDLEFQYKALSYIAPQKVQFRYQLEGYDRDWIESGNKKSASYTNLKPGKYKFHVIACNADGVWNTAGDSCAIELLPHFYQTISFYLGCVVLGMAGLWGGYVWRVGHLSKRQREMQAAQELLEAKVEARTVELEAQKQHLEREIEERKKLEEQFLQAQKMEAIGRLAGGIAHDFNNILTVINGNASLLLLNGQPNSVEISDRSQQIVEAAERAANLTRQLLMFSRKQVIQLTRLDLNEVVARMTKLLQRILGEDVSLVSNYAAGLPAIQADTGMIEQILLNLAVNSRDAMPHGGQLTVTTGTETLAPKPAGQNSGAPAGLCVRLTVTDTGSGITPENLPHIFEPFFTTKEIGKGTGLGLATVYGIIKQHQGWIEVESTVGKGSTFRIYFPAMAGATTEKKSGPTTSTLPRGTETILVVEDELIVRLTVCNLLQRFGYTVLPAESGAEAIKVWQKHKDRIQLLLTDIVMPGNMPGYELARQLLAEKPQLKIIYTSGYSEDLADKRVTLMEGVNFLQKPYAPQQLAEALRKTLDPG
jgi:signal transduction histidine kinase/ligand-binding sensor domain-containing protein/CheY-like chemotaxis protein